MPFRVTQTVSVKTKMTYRGILCKILAKVFIFQVHDGYNDGRIHILVLNDIYGNFFCRLCIYNQKCYTYIRVGNIQAGPSASKEYLFDSRASDGAVEV